MRNTFTKQYMKLHDWMRRKRKAMSQKGIVMKKQYFVDQLEGVVYVDPAFLKAAGQIDTDACTLFEKLRNKYPDFKFVKENLNKSTKRTYNNLSYDRMRDFIKICLPENESKQVLEEFNQVYAISKTKDGRYAYVKSWFLSKYKAQYNKSSFAKVDKSETAPATEEEQKGENENG